MRIERCYTKPGRDPLAGLPMRRVTLPGQGPARVPRDWSLRAARAFAAQQPHWTGESGLRDAADRLISGLTGAAIAQARLTSAEAEAWGDELRHMILHRIAVADPALWPGHARPEDAAPLPLTVRMAQADAAQTARLACAAWDGAPLQLRLDQARPLPAPRLVLDLRRFVVDGEIAEEALDRAVRVWTLALAVRAAAPGGRGADLGLAGLGGALMRLGLGYATPEGRAAAATMAARAEAARRAAADELGAGLSAPRLVLAPLGAAASVLGLGPDPIAPVTALRLDEEAEAGGHHRRAAAELAAGLAAQGHGADRIAALLRHVAGYDSLAAAPGIDHAALRRAGLDAEQIARIEAALPEARDLRAVVTPWRLGRAFCAERLGLDAEALPGHGLDLLDRLGFSAAQIAAANRHVFGTGSLRGAAGLDAAQAAAFDCAPEGAGGEHDVQPRSRLAMAAALVQVIGGPVTALLPLSDTATPDTARMAIRAARRAGLSALLLSRDAAAAHRAGTTPETPDLAPRLREILATLPPGTRPGEAPAEVIELIEAAGRSRPEARRHARALRERLLADPLPQGGAPRATRPGASGGARPGANRG